MSAVATRDAASVEPILSVEQLEVSYGPVRAVNGVSLEVRPGETIGLMGPNGAGKTSTLNAIAGLVRSRAVRLDLFGEDVSRLGPGERIRRGLALVPQGRELFPNLTVAENLRAGQWTTRRLGRGALDLSLLDTFPQLLPRLHQRAGTLSGGEQQMCAIARAMASHPKLLLLDEPSMGLSPKLVSAVVDMLAELVRSQGIALLVVEQGIGVLTRLTRTVQVMASGSFVSSLNTATTGSDEELARAYFA